MLAHFAALLPRRGRRPRAARRRARRCWTTTSARDAGGVERHGPRLPGRRVRPRAVRRAGGAHAGRARPRPPRRDADATRSWTRAPTAWPTTCAAAAWGRRPAWACAWSARRRWSWPCWACSRPAAPTCRWTPRIRASAWRYMLAGLRRRPRPHDARRCAERLPAAREPVYLDADPRPSRGRVRPGAGERRHAGEPVARHLHLRLHGPAQGGDDPPRLHGRPAALAAGDGVGRGARVRAWDPPPSLRRVRRRDASAPCAGAERWCWWTTRWSCRSVAEPAGALRQHGPHAPRRSCCAPAASPPASAR